MAAEIGIVWPPAALEAWELRTLRAEIGFAPVDEFGGRILTLADKPTLQPLVSRPVSDTNTPMASEIAKGAPAPGAGSSLKVEAAPETPKDGLSKGAESLQIVQSETRPPQSDGLMLQQSNMPPAGERTKIVVNESGVAPAVPPSPADKVAVEPTDVALQLRLDPSRREVDSASAENMASLPAAVRDDRQVVKSAPQRWDSEHAGRIVLVLASTLLVTFSFLTVVRNAVVRRTTVTVSPQAAPGEAILLVPEMEAEACHELMKQVAADLVRASSAVNSLGGVPALQNALYRELESIRRLLGFSPQTQGNSSAMEAWGEIKSQLISSQQETQRIIGIAEAARASFSFHPVALDVITTRLEAYAFLGVNASASETVLKKTVNALRQCWHPDLAADEEDRCLREIRIKKINVAWDLISRKQMPAF
jgi:hypothetical protein